MSYVQPKFYRFNDDSIKLADYVVSLKLENIRRVLDLCCGCGVLGIELVNQYFSKIEEIYFLEKQKEFNFYIKKNINQFLPSEIKTKIELCDFKEISFENKFDLIISNPPYFISGTGKKSENLNRDICRFWSEYDLTNFFYFLDKTLCTGGKAFFLYRKNNLEDINNVLGKISLRKTLNNACIYEYELN